MIAAMRRRAAAAADPSAADPDLVASRFRPCPECGGKAGRCGVDGPCKGLGSVPEVEDLSQAPWMTRDVLQVIRMHGFIQRHGLTAYIQVHGPVSECELELMELLTSELERLEHEDRVEQARKARRTGKR